ncbi:serine/threonine-protein kinase [Nocardia sp. SSK8]|uniref:serine/threonine-protein kinase n=1 Tax=Nocardia sp. SSK8 TaxID=3120154 RepID=UPI00300B622A
MVLDVGASFAGYRLERVLGQGGMGTVYLAQHPRLPRSVALKLLNREFSGDRELQRRFEQEADVVAQLDHPGIVGVFDRGSDDGYLWIAMQFIRGTDAATWDSRAHEPGVTARLIGETGAALDYANQHGILHRDVKPGNILIAEPDHGLQQRAVLTDFGIARVTTAATQLTATGTFTATIAYASPEQLSGEVVDHRSDQYSLACTLFALYAGHPPYASTNPGQAVMGHLSQPVPRLSASRTDLPPALDGVIARAMAKRRDERFGSATEFTDAVRDALEGKHIAAPPMFQPWSGPARAHGSGEHAVPGQSWAGGAQQHGAGGQPWAGATPHGSSGQPGTGGQPHGSGEHAQQAAEGRSPQHQGSGEHAQQSGTARPYGAHGQGRQQPMWPQPEYGVPVGDVQRPWAHGNPWQQASLGPEPSKAGAIFAGSVTLLISLGIFAFLIYGITETLKEIDRGDDPTGSFIAIAVLIAIVAFTGSGGLLLLLARTTGRVLTIFTAVIVAVFALIMVIVLTVQSEYVGTAISAAVFVLAASLVACAASTTTGRWISYRKALRTQRW